MTAEVEKKYPRDMVGYGQYPPHPQWPNRARIAVSFVLNYEEGGENSIIHGDPSSEWLLSDIVGATPYMNQRHMNMESLYEYGSRAGFWRLHRVFTERNLPVTVYAVGMALERNPSACKAMVQAGWEIASHGYRWIDYQNVPEIIEREHIRKTVEVQERCCGIRPVGMYQGKPNANTRKLVVEEGGFVYDCDAYNDDMPYWVHNIEKPFLCIPYTLEANDMRFTTANSGEQFYQYLKDAFDQLYDEGATSPKMLSIGLHCRLVGRPGRIHAFVRFLDYVRSKERVWICRRQEIAKHWYTNFYPSSEQFKGASVEHQRESLAKLDAHNPSLGFARLLAAEMASKPQSAATSTAAGAPVPSPVQSGAATATMLTSML